jgi:hypothetical protein
MRGGYWAGPGPNPKYITAFPHTAELPTSSAKYTTDPIEAIAVLLAALESSLVACNYPDAQMAAVLKLQELGGLSSEARSVLIEILLPLD